MMLRFLTTIILLLSVVLLPYWLYLPAIAIAMVYFPFFFEGVAIGFVIDLLYGYGSGLSQYSFAIGALLLLFIMLPVRDRLRFYV